MGSTEGQNPGACPEPVLSSSKGSPKGRESEGVPQILIYSPFLTRKGVRGMV